MASHLLWLAGAYLAGTLPSTLIAARVRAGAGGRALVAEARRESGETDPHVLMTRHLGPGWAVAAMTADVVKGFAYLLVARGVGGLPPGWLGACGVAVVLGHAFPFYAARMAGRGMAAASGVYLALLPWEMVVAGVLIAIGILVKNSGVATTVGMASIPAIAAWQGQPDAFVVMAAAIFGLLMVRRLEGVGEVVRSGVPVSRAVLYRCVFDASAVPRAGEVPGGSGLRPPSGS
jgi:acyl phosphate:glycerol-3-phosphate acyltransferase